MSFGLKLYASRDIGNAAAPIVAPVKTGVGTAPNLLNGVIGMHLFTVEVDRCACLLHQFAILEAGRPKNNIVRIPLTYSVVSIVGRLSFIDQRPHTMLRGVSVENLHFIAVLK